MKMLPSGFEALETFVSKWSVPGEAERAALRSRSTAEERRSFYAAAQPLLAAMLDRLDKIRLTEMEDAERALLHLVLSLASVARAEETLGHTEAGHMPSRDRLKLVNRSGF